MATVHSLPTGAGSVEPRQDPLPEDMSSPILASDAELESVEDDQHTRSPTPTPPPGLTPVSSTVHTLNALAIPAQPTAALHPHPHHQQHPHRRTLHVPASLRRNNSNSFLSFNEIPTLPAFLNSCNLSQYLQCFNEAGAADNSMVDMIDFDDNELKSIMDVIPMKPFHAVTFRRGIRDLRDRSRMGSMHFDNVQSSFMQPEPHSMLHYSHSQFFQQPSQPSQSSQPSHLSQTSHPSQSSIHSSQPSRGGTGGYGHHLQGITQTPGMHRQSSTSKGASLRASTQSGSSQQQQQHQQQHPAYLPTPSQVLSGGAIYQYVGPAPRGLDGSFLSQPVPVFQQEPSTQQKSSTKSDHHRSLKRRRSSTETPPDSAGHEDSSPVLPEPSSFNSNSSSSWSSTPNTAQSSMNTQHDAATRELIMHQALIYGKHSSRSLTKYEQAINEAAQKLALEDPGLLTNKGQLWTKAKAKLLDEDYDYKRGKSRSKLPEAERKKDHKSTKERLVQKREANASNTAKLRVRRINSLNEQYHRKTADREALLACLLRLESPEYKQSHPTSFEGQAKQAREDLARVENERQALSKELGSLKNKERKHQWYEKRKKHRADNGELLSEQDTKNGNEGTDGEADEEAETDTTVDPEGEASQKSLASRAEAIVTDSKPLMRKNHNPPIIQDAVRSESVVPAPACAPSATTRSKKAKDVFRPSEYSAAVKS